MTELSHSDLKNLFSKQSSVYAKYRPTYPDSFFEYLASLTHSHDLAWDCATGNGQAAIKLGEFYHHVIATDLNENQLAHATPHPHVDYRVMPAEKTELADASVDIITVAQAFHWFNQEEFMKEAKRVLKPGGVIALWCYGLAQITPAVDKVLYHFYADLLDGYWEKERRFVDDNYQTIHFPFEELKPPAFETHTEWTLEHVLGYLGTWSAFQTYLKANPNTPNPLETTYKEQFTRAWPVGKKELPVKWDLGMRIGRFT